MAVWTVFCMDTVEESGGGRRNNFVSKYLIQPGRWRADAGRDGRTSLARTNFQAYIGTGAGLNLPSTKSIRGTCTIG